MEPGEVDPSGDSVQSSITGQTITFAPNCSQLFSRIGLCYIIKEEGC